MPVERAPRLFGVVLPCEELNQLDGRVSNRVSIRRSQPTDPFPLFDGFKLETRIAEIRQEVACPVEGVRADDVEDSIGAIGNTGRLKRDVDDGVCDSVDGQPEGRFVKLWQGSDCRCGLEHEWDCFSCVPDAVFVVPNDLADAKDACLDACLLCGFDA